MADANQLNYLGQAFPEMGMLVEDHWRRMACHAPMYGAPFFDGMRVDAVTTYTEASSRNAWLAEQARERRRRAAESLRAMGAWLPGDAADPAESAILAPLTDRYARACPACGQAAPTDQVPPLSAYLAHLARLRREAHG